MVYVNDFIVKSEIWLEMIWDVKENFDDVTIGKINCKKYVFRYIGRMEDLSKFIALSTEKRLPFFKVLKWNKDFSWGRINKRLLRAADASTQLGTLARSVVGETLYLHVVASLITISATLIREEYKV